MTSFDCFHIHSIQLPYHKKTKRRTRLTSVMVDFLGNPDRFLLWWMVDGPGQLHVSCRSKVRPLPLGGRPHGAFRPWLVVSNLVTVWIGKRYERETMRFLAGFLLLLLPPPPSEAATNTAGLQESILYRYICPECTFS